MPQNDPDANDTNNGIDNNDATANSNANATPENTGITPTNPADDSDGQMFSTTPRE